MLDIDSDKIKYAIAAVVIVAFFIGIGLYMRKVSHFTPDKPPEQITLYYAEWCGHCKRLKPIWDEFKKYVNDNNLQISISEVEAKQLEQEPEDIQNKITGFPTLIRGLTNEVIVGGQPIVELLEKLKSASPAPNVDLKGSQEIILYYSNNCPHCQTIFPECLNIKRYVIDRKLPFTCKEYEASEIPESDTSKIKGFPTMVYNNQTLVGSAEVLKTLTAFKTSFDNSSNIQYNLYYSKSCAYSTALMPTWYKFVNKYDQVYSITTQELGELEKKPDLIAKITAVPMLIVVDENTKETTYVGLDDIEKLIKPMLK